MAGYADFHVLTATLSPVFLFARLVAHYRAGVGVQDRVTRGDVMALLVLMVVTSLLVVSSSLLVLGDLTESVPVFRAQQIVLLRIQSLSGGVIAVAREAARNRP